MATSTAQIANLALGRIGVLGIIEDLDTDTSTEGLACRDVYEQALDEVLAAHDWPWATRQASLALLFEVADLTEFTRLDWLYGYALPSDCVKPRDLWPGVRNPAPGDLVPYALENYSSATVTEQLVLFTDLQSTTALPAVLRYTRRVEDVALYPASFVRALALRIAAEIAGPIKKESARELADRDALANQALETAIAAAKNQERPDQAPVSTFIRSRW